jgi:hypothetical protein
MVSFGQGSSELNLRFEELKGCRAKLGERTKKKTSLVIRITPMSEACPRPVRIAGTVDDSLCVMSGR